MITTIRGDQLIVVGRQRMSVDADGIAELAISIATSGLLHPIVLRNDHRTLVAGERRVRAMALLFQEGKTFKCDGVEIPKGYLPYIAIADMDSIAVEEAELEENVKRVDLSWQDYNSAVARLHILREKQAVARGERHFPIQTISEFTGRPKEEINTDTKLRIRLKNALLLHENMHDPEIREAKSEKDAMKIIEKRAHAKHREALSKEFKDLPSRHTVVCGKMEDLVHTLVPASIDIVLTDPPYGIDADDFGGQAEAKHDYEDSADYALECYARTFQAAHVFGKSSSFCFTFCDIRMFPAIYKLAETYLPGWKLWETPLIWDKSGNGMLPVPDKGPRRTYEAIFYAYRGTRKWNATGTADLVNCVPVVRPEFGAMKPVDLFVWLLGRVSLPGDIVLDPFAGTGPIVGAAKILQCTAIAFEKDQQKVDWIWTKHMRSESLLPETDSGDGKTSTPTDYVTRTSDDLSF